MRTTDLIRLASTAIAAIALVESSADAQNMLYVTTSASQLIRYEPNLSVRHVMIDPQYLIDDRMAVAPGSGRLYWATSASGRVHRAEADGLSVATIINQGLLEPHTVAVDETSNALFIYDRGVQTIFRATADGAILTAIIPNVASVEFIDVDAANDHLYWSQRKDKSLLWQIRRADYNGQDVQTVVDDSSSIAGFDVDDIAGNLYWCDVQALRRSDLDGMNAQVLHAPAQPNAVRCAAADPDDDRVYFVEQTSDQQFAMNFVPIAGGVPTHFAAMTFPPPHIAIDADDDALFWIESGGIVRHDGVSATTHVPSIATPLSTFALDHAGWRVFSASTGGTGNIWKTSLATSISQIIHTHNRTIYTIAYDHVNDMVLWLDDLSDVYRCDTDGGNVQTLISSGIISGQDLFVDPVTEKFYIADSGPDEVVQFDLDGSNETVVINMGGSLVSFAIDHIASMVYYANNSGLTHHVQKVPIGGTIALTVLQETATFEQLRLNTDDDRLYWLTSNPRQVRRAEKDGTNITTLDLTLSAAATPIAMALGPFIPIGDVNGDGVVNLADLLMVIAAWGACSAPCAADVNGDGTVNIIDLLLIVSNWS